MKPQLKVIDKPEIDNQKAVNSAYAKRLKQVQGLIEMGQFEAAKKRLRAFIELLEGEG